MEKQIEDFYRSLRGRRVAFIGTGVTNQQCIELFARCGAQITLCDKKPDIDAFGPYAQALRKLDIRFSLGEHYLDGLAGQEMIMRTPGFEYYTPELVAAREAGAEVTQRDGAVLPALSLQDRGRDGLRRQDYHHDAHCKNIGGGGVYRASGRQPGPRAAACGGRHRGHGCSRGGAFQLPAYQHAPVPGGGWW